MIAFNDTPCFHSSTQISKLFRFHNQGPKEDDLMFEPCYTFLQGLNNARQWLDFNMQNVEDVFLIFHRNLGLASSLFDTHANDWLYFQSVYSEKGRLLSRYIEVELE